MNVDFLKEAMRTDFLSETRRVEICRRFHEKLGEMMRSSAGATKDLRLLDFRYAQYSSRTDEFWCQFIWDLCQAIVFFLGLKMKNDDEGVRDWLNAINNDELTVAERQQIITLAVATSQSLHRPVNHESGFHSVAPEGDSRDPSMFLALQALVCVICEKINRKATHG